MSTAGDDPRSWVLYVVLVIVTAFVAGPDPRTDRAARSWWWPPPVAAVVLWTIVAIPSLIRLVFPHLLDVFVRVPDRVRDGQWWRVMTSMLVQDGGVAGTVGNLLVLGVVAIAAVRVWGWYRAVGLFVVGQLLWGLFTSFVEPSSGAGASGATFALAASVAGLWPVVGAARYLLVASGVTLVVGIGLVAWGDAHGVAVLIGMLLGAVVGTVLPPPDRPVPTGAAPRGDVGS
ncbi:rhomboid family intramembrane serine protease [Rhodococcus yananensis]|uniref:rhomboid family intramembrane serine protease n=1 Tax=Rhodococcus yananensis TaxID=2879464 RepID=UPI003EB70370